MHKVLVKANDDLISFCKCESPTFATNGQLDCPWCGCGWLFSCVDCRKAFSFAKVVESKTDQREICERDAKALGIWEDLTEEEIQGEVDYWQHQIDQFPIGTVCVIIDEKILPVGDQHESFTGTFATHNFKKIPHVEANGSRERILELLGNSEYWLQNANEDYS